MIKISPLALFLILLGLTAFSAVLEFVLDRRRGARLAALSQRAGMTFVRRDRFDLARDIADLIDIPGAAGVRVRDVMYASHPTGSRYVFTAEFTTGVTRGKRRRARAVAIDRWTSTAREVILAPETLTLSEQYEHLLRRLSPNEPTPASSPVPQD